MYNFILNQWIMEKISEEKVRSYSPKYITQQELDEILNK